MQTSEWAEVFATIAADQADIRIHYPEGGQDTFLIGTADDRYGWIVSMGPGWVHGDDLDHSPQDTLRAMINVFTKRGIVAVITAKEDFDEKFLEGLDD